MQLQLTLVEVLRHGRDDAPDLGKVTSRMTKQVKLQSRVVLRSHLDVYCDLRCFLVYASDVDFLRLPKTLKAMMTEQR